jgi:alpha-acetolactate decarboxylase
MRKVNFQINDPIEINGKLFNIKAEGTITEYPGSYIDPAEMIIDYDYLKINNQDVSMLDNDLFRLISSSIDPQIMYLVESRYHNLVA